MSENYLMRGDHAGSAAIIGDMGSECPFEVAFRPAKPVLDATVEMRRPVTWLDCQRVSRLPLFNLGRAHELINLIPANVRLYKAQNQFSEAEQEPAPEGLGPHRTRRDARFNASCGERPRRLSVRYHR